MSPVLKRKMKLLALILPSRRRRDLRPLYTETAGVDGLISGVGMGLTFGFIELLALDRWGKRLRSVPFGRVVVIKTAICTAGVFITGHTVAFISGWSNGSTLDQFWTTLIDPG